MAKEMALDEIEGLFWWKWEMDTGMTQGQLESTFAFLRQNGINDPSIEDVKSCWDELQTKVESET